MLERIKILKLLKVNVLEIGLINNFLFNFLILKVICWYIGSIFFDFNYFSISLEEFGDFRSIVRVWRFGGIKNYCYGGEGLDVFGDFDF